MKIFFPRYWDISGTSSRTEFWIIMLLQWLITTAVATFAETPLVSEPENSLLRLSAPYTLTLIMVAPVLTLSVRRLRDAGSSGWWVLIAFVPQVGYLIFLYLMTLPSTTDEAGDVKFENVVSGPSQNIFLN